MADSTGAGSKLPALDSGHADNSAPKTVDGKKFQSAATFVPLSDGDVSKAKGGK